MNALLLRTKKAMQIKEDFVKSLSLKKIKNYFKFENDLKKKKIVTSSFPPVITFEPSAFCNTNCQLCPVGLKIKGPKTGFMTMETFRKVIDEAKDYLVEIAFADWGEPFLNPDIYDMIKYAEKKKILTHASTNLHYFKSEKQMVDLIESGLSFLTISLHGVSQETYGAYQPGKDFAEITKRIDTLVSLKKKMKTKKPRIDFAFAITKKNQHEIGSMQQFVEGYGADKDIYTASLNLRLYSSADELVHLVEEWAQDREIDMCDISTLEKAKIKDLYKNITEEKNLDFVKLDRLGLTARHFCHDPWRTFTVSWNGSVSLCCVDYSKYDMGNVKDETTIKIWNNEKYRTLRKYLLTKVDDGKNDFPCKTCIKY